MLLKFQALRWENVTELDAVLDACCIIADYIFAILFVMTLHERPGSLRNLFFSFVLTCLYLKIVKPGMNSRTHGRVGQTKW